MTLDACMLKLSEVAAAKKQVAGLYRVAKSGSMRNGMRARIPSWVNLSAVGEAWVFLFPIPFGQFCLPLLIANHCLPICNVPCRHRKLSCLIQAAVPCQSHF